MTKQYGKTIRVPLDKLDAVQKIIGGKPGNKQSPSVIVRVPFDKLAAVRDVIKS